MKIKKTGVVSLATVRVAGGFPSVPLVVPVVFSERSLTSSPLIGWLRSGASSDAGKSVLGSADWKKYHREFGGKYLVFTQAGAEK